MYTAVNFMLGLNLFLLHLNVQSIPNIINCRVHKFDVPRLPHLMEFLDEDNKHIMDEPIQVRKGFSYKVMLGKVFTSHR